MHLLPEKIGKYVIDSILGRGGMGEVYKAHDPTLGRYVALKLMRGPSLDDTNARERFIREAQAAGGLRHPNVVTVYDLGEVDGQQFIAMEFIEGYDLEKIIKERSPMNVDDKLSIMIQVSEGISYAHKNQIVHRDLKPSNIRIDNEGVVKIMDFGIAKLESSNMTSSGTVLGTPFYMSPEQVRGIRVDARSDIFALGSILYELLTFEKAFPGEMANVFYKIVHEEPQPLSISLDFDCTELQKIVDICIQKDKNSRLQSSGELAELLQQAQQFYREQNIAKSSGIKTGNFGQSADLKISPAPTALSNTQRRKGSITSVPTPQPMDGSEPLPPTQIGGMPKTVVVGRSSSEAMAPDAQPYMPPSTPQKGKIGLLIGIVFFFLCVAGAAAYFFLRPKPDPDPIPPVVNNEDVPVKKDDDKPVKKPPTVSPAEIQAEMDKGKELQKDNKLDEAVAVYQAVLLKDPENAEAYYLIGAARQKQHRTPEALVSYQRALELNPTLDKAWQQLGYIYSDRMDYSAAERSFQEAIKLKPNSPAAWEGLAQTYLITQNHAKAEEAFKKVLEFEPNNYVAYYNLGQVQMTLKKNSDAKNSFLRVIQINPNYAEAHNNLGSIYLSEHQYDQSIVENEKALQLKPNLPSAFYSLSIAYEQKRDFRRAAQNLQKYLELTNDNDPELQKKLQSYRQS